MGANKADRSGAMREANFNLRTFTEADAQRVHDVAFEAWRFTYRDLSHIGPCRQGMELFRSYLQKPDFGSSLDGDQEQLPKNMSQPLYQSVFLSRVQAAARRIGADFYFHDRLNGRLATLQRNSQAAFLGASPLQLWPFNSALGASIANDKELTLRLLAEQQIRVPKTQIAFVDISSFAHLENRPPAVGELLLRLTYPLVVKPNSSFGGTGISFVYGPSRLQEAVAYAGESDQALLFQELVSGRDFKLLVLDRNPLVLVERKARALYGDGKRSISELSDLNRAAMGTGQEISTRSYIDRYGDRVLAGGEALDIYAAANLSQGGKILSCTTETAEVWHAIAERVSRAIPLRLFSLDCRGEPCSALTVLEVNANPGVEFLYTYSSAMGDTVMDLLIERALESSDEQRVQGG